MLMENLRFKVSNLLLSIWHLHFPFNTVFITDFPALSPFFQTDSGKKEMLGLVRAPLVHLTSSEVGSPPALDWWIRGRFSRCSLGSGAVAGAAVPSFVTALTATILPSQAEPTACCLHRVSGLYLTPLGLINRLLLIKMRTVPDPPLSFFCLPF